MLLACLMLTAMAGCGGTTSQPQQEAQPAATQAAPVSHAEADAVNAAIKQLPSTAANADAIVHAAEKLDEVTALIRKVPDDAKDLIDMAALDEKLDKQDDAIKALNKRSTDDLEALEAVGSATEEYIRTLYYQCEAWSDGDDANIYNSSLEIAIDRAISKLESISTFDVSDTLSKAEALRKAGRGEKWATYFDAQEKAFNELETSLKSAHYTSQDDYDGTIDAIQTYSDSLKKLLDVL